MLTAEHLFYYLYIKDRKVPVQKKPLLTKRLSSALSREKHEPQYTLANLPSNGP